MRNENEKKHMSNATVVSRVRAAFPFLLLCALVSFKASTLYWLPKKIENN